ncbi:MAG: hypothetical protein ACREU2_14825 [Steroidobacteraceae bacterium]
MAASAPAQAAGAVIKSARRLVEAGKNPSAPAADAIVNKLTTVCAEHGLGDSEVYLRFTPFICRVNHQPLPPLAERTYEFLAQALRLRTRERAPLLPTVTVPALHLTSAELSAVRRAYARQVGGEREVTRLYRGGSLPEENCWLRGDNWCLALA